MKKGYRFYLMILIFKVFCFITGCTKINILPPENHPSTVIKTVEECHLNLLLDEDREFYLKENNLEKEAVYTCKMHPQIRTKKQDFCAICGMKLTLEYGK